MKHQKHKGNKPAKAAGVKPGSTVAGSLATEPAVVKLSKQERRNLNKIKKATLLVAPNVIAANSASARNESVYKRETVYPPAVSDSSGPWDRFLTPADPNFAEVLKTSYDGLVVSTRDKFKPSFHTEFESAMRGLDEEGFYQFDVTQPAGLGTKLAKTFVTRCLVGEPGTTYKYLGLRMFSIPWSGTEGTEASSSHARQIGELNTAMIHHTADLLKRSGREKVGSCQYNLTLINR
jgi:hypothetical protein